MNLLLATITDWHSFFFYLFAAITCAFALAVLFSNHIVHMAFYLVISLGASAGLFILAGAEFVGAMQLLIYVGGTLVLLIFGVMLTAQERFISMKTRGGEWVMGALVGGALLVLLVRTAFGVDDWSRPRPHPEEVSPIASQTATQLGLALLGIRPDASDHADPRLRQGMSGYLLLFEIASVHLLIVLIGAAYLARTKRFHPAYADAPALRHERSPKRRGRLATLWTMLWLVVDISALATLVYVMARRDLTEDLLAQMGAPRWLLTVSLFLTALHIICLIALLNWQRWAFSGLVVMAAVFVVVNSTALGLVPGLATAAAQALSLFVLYGLLKIGGAQSMWAQLE